MPPILKIVFYLEVQPHSIPEQQKLNSACVELANELGLPLVATTDCHYLDKSDHYAQEVLMCISTGKQITDPDRIKHEGVDLHLKTYQEMLEEFGTAAGFATEAIENTLNIAEQCNLKFDFSKHFMPHFELDDPRPLIDVMAEMARDGLKQRLEHLRSAGADDEINEQVYSERLEEEITLIGKMGFAGYF